MLLNTKEMIPILNIVINGRITIPNSFCEAGISLILKADKEVIERKVQEGRSCGPVVKTCHSRGRVQSLVQKGPHAAGHQSLCNSLPSLPSQTLRLAAREAPVWEACTPPLESPHSTQQLGKAGCKRRPSDLRWKNKQKCLKKKRKV